MRGVKYFLLYLITFKIFLQLFYFIYIFDIIDLLILVGDFMILKCITFNMCHGEGLDRKNKC